jgi:L-lysine exporter family protein LysE/ArgO
MNQLTLFFEGFFLGLGVAVPFGPINILIMNEALRSYKNALAVGFGALSADLTYLFLILYGMTHYLKESIFLNILSLFGAFFLLYLSYLIYKSRNEPILKIQNTKEKSLFLHYVQGYFLTLLSPLTLFFWLSVTSHTMGVDSMAIRVFAMIFAILLWILLMPLLVYKKRSLISSKILYAIALISSIIIFIYGVVLLLKNFEEVLLSFVSLF